MLFWFVIFALLALIAYNVVVYMRSPGTTAERLSAGWKDSMTIFVGIWGAVATLAVTGLDMLASLTGDPMFAQWEAAVKTVIPAQYQPMIPIAALTATMLARLRTLGK